MLKKILFFLVSLIIGIVLFVGVIHFVGWQELRSALNIFRGWHGLVILFLTALVIFVGAWKWRIILSSQGYDLAKRDVFKLYLASFSLSYFFPLFMGGGTGTILRGYVLREKFFVPWRRGAASLIIERFLEITVGLLVILTGLVLLLLKTGTPFDDKQIFLLFGIILFTVFVFFLYFKFFRSESIVGFFARIFGKSSFINGTAQEIERDIFEFFNLKKAFFWKVAGLALLKAAVIGLRSWILVLFLGKILDPFYVFPIMAFYFLAILIPVPAMLGTHEITQTFAFSSLGIGAGLAPAFTLIQRGAEVVLALIGFMILFKLGTDLFKTILNRKFSFFLR